MLREEEYIKERIPFNDININEDDLKYYFSERLKRLRIEKKYTKAQLSSKCGLATTYISRIEGKDPFLPSFDTIIKLLKALDCSFEKFFYSDFDNYEKDLRLAQKFNNYDNNTKNAIAYLLTRKS